LLADRRPVQTTNLFYCPHRAFNRVHNKSGHAFVDDLWNRAFPKMPLVSISDHQRGPMPPSLNWMTTIDHGLPATLYRFNQKGGSYLAFLGRIAPEKRPDRAIEIAKRAGIPLKIAAKVDPADQEYFAHVIEPLLHDPLVEFIGEIGDHEKNEFLGNALALLFPIDWPEPFGLVMIEAMATGTPVIGWRCSIKFIVVQTNSSSRIFGKGSEIREIVKGRYENG
jgi:glycosyltransferase involved in cell wall biosynthesis